MRVIVYTRFDGGVSLCIPAPECIRELSSGGAWGGMPRGFVETQIERQIAAGHRPDAARRFAHGMAFGGLTTAEALDVIAERDCRHLGTGLELCIPSELPSRWFRDAWRRGANGGPINIDLRLARPIQWKRIRQFVADENKRRSEAWDGLPELKPDFGSIKDQIKRADDSDSLQRIWIDEIKPASGGFFIGDNE